MKILFYRYGSICEPDVIACFEAAGITVEQDTAQITEKKLTGSDTVKAISERLSKDAFLFVFSINFFPAVSDTCNLFNIPYVSWTVDSPIMELFSPSVKNKCNRIFFFDKAQYEYFGKGEGYYFHLPLATNVSRWENVISAQTDSDRSRFSSDISMIGSLYSEKNRYSEVHDLNEKTRGYVDGIIASQLQVYGYNFIEQLLTDEIVQEFEKAIPDFKDSPYAPYMSKKYVLANFYIGMELAFRERVNVLNTLAKMHKVDLYTRSDSTILNNVNVHPGVKTLTEMPLIFNNSKINLNITIKPIQTGLSLRVFDVLGCGGFLITNYQDEISEYYEIGKDIEVYTSIEELEDKCAYYLSHDDERKKIALSGFERTKKLHTYSARFTDMIKLIYSTL